MFKLNVNVVHVSLIYLYFFFVYYTSLYCYIIGVAKSRNVQRQSVNRALALIISVGDWTIALDKIQHYALVDSTADPLPRLA